MTNHCENEKTGRENETAPPSSRLPVFSPSRLLFLIAATLLALCTHAAAQTQTPIYNLRAATNAPASTNWIAVVTRPNATNGTEKFQLSALINMVNIALTNTQGTNLVVTNATVLPIFYQNNGNLLEFLGLQQGTNIVLYRTTTSIVVNATGTGSGGSSETQWFPDQSQFFTNGAGAFVIKSGATTTNLDFWGATEFFTGGISVGGNSSFTNNLNVDGSVIVGGVFLAQSTSGFTGSSLFSTNATISGTNRANWVQLTGGQAGQGVFAIFDNNTNLVGWLGTNSFPTHALLVTASNAVYAALVANDTTTSNALRTLLIANDTTTSNGAVAFSMTASNSVAALAIANDTTTSNALRTLLIANDTITSNGAVAFSITASNTLDTKIENTLSNYYLFGYSVGAGFSNTTSKPLVTIKANRMLEVMSLVAGANIALTPSSTGIVVTATGASLADGDYGDVTATAGGATITIDNDVVTDAKLRESAGFSVIGKTDTGTGNPADIVAAADGVLRRSGSGNLTFGSLVTANYADDSVTVAKFQNVAENRILGRDSTGSGNVEELPAGLGLDITGGSLVMLADQVLGSARFTNSLAASNINTRQLIVTNTVELGTTNTALTTNIALNWNGPSIIESYPTNTTFMVSFVGAPSASNGLSKTIRHRIILTNTPTMVGPSGVGWLNSPVLIAGSLTTHATNYFTYTFNGNTNIDALSLQTSNLLSGTLISGAHITGSVFSNGVVYFPVYTNNVLLGLVTNIDFVNGITGYVNGVTARLGTTGAGGSGATNTPVLATGLLDLTNQIKLRPQSLNGSNATQVMLDFTLQTHKKVTNPIGALLIFIGTNYTQGHRAKVSMRGLSGTTNNVVFTNGASGVNFRWLNWPTNGSYDLAVRGNYNYDVDALVEDPTNITFHVTTDDPYVVVPEVQIAIAHTGTNNLETITNLSSVNWRLLTMLIPTNNSASNITVNYASSNRVEIYLTNNATFTNYSGYVPGRSGTKQMWIRPQLITRGVNWGVGIGYSVRVLTNGGNPLWTSLTNDKLYVVTDDWQSTNIIRTIALFE